MSGLNSVLRWRRSLQRAAQLSLNRVIAEINLNIQEQQRTECQRVELRRALRDGLQKSIGSEEFAMYSEVAIDRVERCLKETLQLLEGQREEAEAHYAERRQDRKVIENVVSRCREEERMESTRREQVEIDEATLRRATIPTTESSIDKSE